MHTCTNKVLLALNIEYSLVKKKKKKTKQNKITYKIHESKKLEDYHPFSIKSH